MKLWLPIVVLISVVGKAYSQIDFEAGYYIDNAGKKIECQIKNRGWVTNPDRFEYKRVEDPEAKFMTVDSVQEFSINNTLKYITSSVDIDRSPTELGKLSDTPNPSFNTERLFLRMLVEGNANLYYYEEKGLKRFFFSVNGSKLGFKDLRGHF